jgi:SNF2 family DNA or RNA helicase
MKYRFKTRPYKHQYRAIKFLIRKRGVGALLMEPRTGKTKTTVDFASMLAQRGRIDRMVVVCPARVMGVWIEEFHRHSPLLVNIILWDADARQTAIPKPSGHYDLHVVLVNYEAFNRPGHRLPSGRRSTATGRFKARQRLRAWLAGKPALCVLDESHKIKSPSSKAGTMLVSMRDDFTYRMILTGTPQTKAARVFDLYMQWHFLNPARFADVPTLADFKNRYGQWIMVEAGGHAYPKWTGPANMRELRQRVHADSFAVKREDCFDLPPKDVRIIHTPLTKSRIAYRDMAKQMVHQIQTGEITEATIKLTQALRLAQITGGCVGLQELIPTPDGAKRRSWSKRIGSEKLDVLKDILLDEVYDRDDKIVIAARFKSDLDAIGELCEKLGIDFYMLRGGMKRGDTDANIRHFRDHPGPAAFIMQPGAGSLGIDLSTAAHMVWYSLTTSWVDYTQSCDRIALSRRSTTFTYLIAPGTVDQLLYDTLQNDGDVSRAILDKPERLLLGG